MSLQVSLLMSYLATCSLGIKTIVNCFVYVCHGKDELNADRERKLPRRIGTDPDQCNWRCLKSGGNF